MAVCDISFYSNALNNTSGLTVMLPRTAPPPWGVLYLLHGLGGCYTDWQYNTTVDSRIGDSPMMIVSADGGRSYYANSHDNPGGNRWEDHIIESVVGFVDRTFPTKPDPSGRVIAGLSMGGYGAMMLALRHPDIFGATLSTSGSMYFAAMDHPLGEKYPTELMNSLPSDEYDCFKLAKALKKSGEDLKIRFDCGLDDALLGCNQKFHTHLNKLKIPHDFVEHPGQHNWSYWRKRVPEIMSFARKYLKGK